VVIHVLGPLKLTDADLPVPLGPPRVRRAMARLVVDRGRFVSVDALTDAIWDDSAAPKRPDKAVQDIIADLRHALAGVGSDSIDTRPDGRGYRIRLNTTELDATLVTREVGDGRTSFDQGDLVRAAALFGAALERFEGNPYEEYADEEFARAEIDRLEELRWAAIEGELAATVGMGQPIDLAALPGLAAEQPTRWRLWAAWMLALYADGRQADALTVFQRASEQFAERGLEPPRELRLIDQRIAADDRTLTERGRGSPFVSPQDRRLPGILAESLRSTLVGRDPSIASLQQSWGRCLAGSPCLVTICGEEGAGKSSLAASFARATAAGGGLVLAGRAHTTPTGSYQPVADAVGTHLRGLDPEAADGIIENPEFSPLLRLLPSISPLPLTPPGDANAERQAMFTSIGAYLRYLCEEQPVLLVLDDLQWIDAASAELIGNLMRTFAVGQRLLMLLVHRDDNAASIQPLTEVLAIAARLNPARIRLGGLDSEDLVELVQQRLPGVRGAQRLGQEIRQLTEGNPLFVDEVLRQLQELDVAGDPIDLTTLDHLAVPEGIRAVVYHRIGALTTSAVAILSAAAVIGPRFSIGLLERLGLGARDQLLDALDEGVRAGLVIDEVEVGPELAFRHAYYQTILTDLMLTARRADLHARIAEALRAEPRDANERVVANHLLAAGDAADLRITQRTVCDAAVNAARQLDFAESRGLLDRLEAVLSRPQVPDRTLLARLGITRASVERLSGDVAATKEAAIAAWNEASEAGDLETLVAAAIEHATFGGEAAADPMSLSLLHRSLERVTDDGQRARLLARLAYHHAMWSPGSDAAVGTATEALALAEQLGDPAVLCMSLWAAAAAVQGDAEPEKRLGLGERLILIAEESHDDRAVANGLRVIALSSLECGDVARFDASVSKMSEVADRARSWMYHADVARWRAMSEMNRGDWSSARSEMERQRTSGGDVAIYPASYAAQRMMLHRDVGELDSARRFAEAAVTTLSDLPALGAFRAALSLIASEMGDTTTSEEHFRDLVADDHRLLEPGRTYSTAVAMISEVATRADHRDAASGLLAAIEPYRGLLIVASWGEVCLGAADRYRGMLLGLLGRDEEAIAAFHQAVSLEESIGARALTARSLWWLSQALDRAGRDDESATTRGLVDAVASELKMHLASIG
jgi:DNA-binding SARP family transcriptional activator